MKRNVCFVLQAGIVLFCLALTLNAQDVQFTLGDNSNPVQPPANMQFAMLGADVQTNITQSQAAAASASSNSLQTFTRSITSTKDGKVYQYTIVGRDPYLRGKLPTTTQTPVFPVVITFSSDGSVFNPNVPTACS